MTLPFHHIFVINLDKRTDRLAHIQSEAKRVGFDFERISAIPEGVYGCRQSHILAAKKARDRNYPSYLVLEDDAQFADNFNVLFERYYPQVPEWDMLLLGGEHQNRYVRQGEGIIRCQSSYKAHALAVKSHMYNTVIDTMEGTSEPCDIALATLHKKHFVYCFHPALVWQKGGYSDLAERYVDYGRDLDSYQ